MCTFFPVFLTILFTCRFTGRLFPFSYTDFQSRVIWKLWLQVPLKHSWLTELLSLLYNSLKSTYMYIDFNKQQTACFILHWTSLCILFPSNPGKTLQLSHIPIPYRTRSISLHYLTILVICFLCKMAHYNWFAHLTEVVGLIYIIKAKSK